MMTSRKAHLAALAALFALSAAGCGVATDSATDAGASTGAGSKEPREALLDSVPDEKVGAYEFDVKGGVAPMSGILDVPKKAVEIKMVQSDTEFTMTMSFLMVGEQAWTKIAFKPADLPGLPKFPKKWMRLDSSKITDAEFMKSTAEADPGYAVSLLENSAAVTATGAGHYAGTTDLTKSTEAEILDEKTLTALGDKAKAVPFEAAVDADGHLTKLTVKIPAAGTAKAQTYTVGYTGYGSTGTPAVPAEGEQTKAPADVYDLLNG